MLLHLSVGVVHFNPKAERACAGAGERYGVGFRPAGQDVGLSSGLTEIYILVHVDALVGVALYLQYAAKAAVGLEAEIVGQPCVPGGVCPYAAVGNKACSAGSAVRFKEAGLHLQVVHIEAAAKAARFHGERQSTAAVCLSCNIYALPSVANAAAVPVDGGAGHSLCARAFHGNLAVCAEAGNGGGVHIG